MVGASGGVVETVGEVVGVELSSSEYSDAEFMALFLADKTVQWAIINQTILNMPLISPMSSFTGVVDLQVLVGSWAGVPKNIIGGTDPAGRLSLTLLLDHLKGVGALAVGVGHVAARADACTQSPVDCRDDLHFLAGTTV